MRWLDGITDLMDESEQALGDGEEPGSLTCCSQWGRKELDMTEQLLSEYIICILKYIQNLNMQILSIYKN